MTEKSTTKKLWSTKRKLHNDVKKVDKKVNNDPHRKNAQKRLSGFTKWSPKIVKFTSLLLILKKSIIINLFIWHFYSLPCYSIQFTIGRHASKIHMHICFEDNDTQVCFYNEESCHKIKTLGLFYHALVATVYEWLVQISSCSLAVLWPEQAIIGDDVLY